MSPTQRRSLLAGAGVGGAVALTLTVLVILGALSISPLRGVAIPPGDVIAALPTPSSSPTATPAPAATPSLTPRPTPSPAGTSMPIASSYPLVNSCDPSSVPTAAAPREVAPASGPFVLRVPVLEYHRIVPALEAGNSQPGLLVSPEHFQAQMDLLEAQGWHAITMATLAEDLAAHVRPSDKTFVATFDDGWDDGYRYALPILRAHGFVGTFYVIAGRIDEPGFLASAHLRALVDAGDEIGNHTFDHTSLSSVDGTRGSYEIDAASARIAQVTGHWPETLAYPYGGTNSRVKVIVAACKILRLAALDGPMKLAEPPAAPSHGATAAAPTFRQYDVYESWATRFDIPRLRVTPNTTPAGLLEKMVKGAAG